MNPPSEIALARESVVTEINIVTPHEWIRADLLNRLDALSDAWILRVQEFVVATLAEKVALDVLMVLRFLEEGEKLTPAEVE